MAGRGLGHAGVAGADGHGRQRRGQRRLRKLAAQRVDAGGRAVKARPLIGHQPQRAIGAAQRLHLAAVALDRVAPAPDPAVHHHQRAQPCCAPAGGHLNGLIQIQRPICAQRCGRPHRAGEHQRLVRGHGQVQEMGAFLQRVGAVGDDDGIHIAAGGQLAHAPGQLQQKGIGQIGRVNGKQRLGLHAGQPVQRGQGGQKGAGIQRSGGVGRARGAGACAGDGAARGEQGNAGQKSSHEKSAEQVFL